MGLRHVLIPGIIRLMEAIVGVVQPVVYIDIELAFFKRTKV